MSGASIVNFEHSSKITLYSTVNFVEFEQIYKCWLGQFSKTIVLENAFIFCNCVKYIVYKAENICWALFLSLFTQHKVPKG